MLNTAKKPKTKYSNEYREDHKQSKCIKCGQFVICENNFDSEVCNLCSDRVLALKLSREMEYRQRATRSKSKLSEESKSNFVDDLKDLCQIKKDFRFYKTNFSKINNPTELFSPILNTNVVIYEAVYDDFVFRPGDIVSVQENDIYHAQIRFLIKDAFCEQYAALIWLLPTISGIKSSDKFNPHIFTYGPQDESFYNLKELTFVMHAPTKFYQRFINSVPKNIDIEHMVKLKFKPYNKI